MNYRLLMLKVDQRKDVQIYIKFKFKQTVMSEYP